MKQLLLAVSLSLTAFPQTSGLKNPLLPSGPDPWIVYRDGWYYYTNTTARNLTLWKTRSVADMATAEKKVVWTPPAEGPYSKQIWAPELHFLSGKWYLYFAADDGRNRNHRLFVLENASPDPLRGEWVMKGQVHTPEDRWAIDGSVFEHRKKLYLVWSGWEGAENGRQDLYICRMKNPWTPMGKRVLISQPQFPWEKIGDIARPGPDDKPHLDVNEGPQALLRGGRVFLVFSASACWTDAYELGMLHLKKGGDPMNAAAWSKLPQPVFSAAGVDGVYAAGHNSFFQSPDGKEDWILYHANSKPGQGCGGTRSPRAQQFHWRADGFPDFGKPIPPAK